MLGRSFDNSQKIRNPKSVIDNAIGKKDENALYHKTFSIFLFFLSIIYIIMPIDYDGTIIGMIDDFFIFMSAFCYMYAQFNKNKLSAYMLLKMVSLIFCFLGTIAFLLLSFFI